MVKTKTGNGKSGVPVVRKTKALGKKRNTENHARTKELMKSRNRSANEKLALLLEKIHPANLEDEPSQNTLDLITAWKGRELRSDAAGRKWLACVDIEQFDDKIKAILEVETEDPLARKAMHEANVALRKAKIYAVWNFDIFKIFYKCIQAKKTATGKSIGSLDLDEVIDVTFPFGKASSKRRMVTICSMGCGFIVESVIEACKRRKLTYDHFHDVKANTKKRVVFCHYQELCRDLEVENLINVHTIDIDKIKEAAELVKGRAIIAKLHILTTILSKHGMQKEILHLQRKLPTRVMSGYERLRLRSEWTKTILDHALEHEMEEIKYRTSFGKQHVSVMTSRMALFTNFLYETIPLEYAGFIEADRDPVEWCFSTQPKAVFAHLAKKYADSRPVMNDRVISSVKSHHADGPLCDALRFFKGGFAKFIAAGDIQLLSRKEIVKTIPNRRIAASTEVRRVFNEEEIAALFEAAGSDTRLVLILTILKEVALRSSATRHLRMRELVDESYSPREICSVKEKAGAIRRFQTGPNLKIAIKQHVEYFRNNVPNGNDRDCFILNPVSPGEPMGSLHYTLKALAKKTNITGVKVHPHAFRHTVVDRLVQAGNSMEFISKFMGHARVQTTATRYWVSTIEDLTKKMNNPFMGDYVAPEEKKEQEHEEVSHIRDKLSICVGMLHIMDNVIKEAQLKNYTADDISLALKQNIPEFKSFLDLAESSCPSTSPDSSSSSMGSTEFNADEKPQNSRLSSDFSPVRDEMKGCVLSDEENAQDSDTDSDDSDYDEDVDETDL
jgi:integrase